MRKKILTVIIDIIGILITIVCGLLLIQMIFMQRDLVSSSQQAGELIENTSEEAMRSQIGAYLKEAASIRAWVSDGEFSKFADSIGVIANTASDIYAHPERYGTSRMEKYGESDMGELKSYIAYGDGVDPEAADISAEAGMAANMQGVLKSVNMANSSMATDYFASESGLFVCAEAVSVYNLPKGNEHLSFEARQRPWYTEARDAGHAVFTGMIKDADTGDYVITCGVPVYADGDFIGVAGAGLFLDTIRQDVDGFQLGENGYACIVNSQGQVLFSGTTTGDLAASEDMDSDIRLSSNTELSGLATDALDGNAGVDIVELDGCRYYIGYAPMETVGWSYMTILPEAEVTAPTKALVEKLDAHNTEQNQYVHGSVVRSVRFIVLLLVAVGGIMLIVAGRFADKLADPIVLLTGQVSQIEGDNLDFECDLRTGDEVQVLGEAFESMTGRMKTYIDDITAITAEKGRIGAELSVAKHIQASMLPCIFPPYPDRGEFELYASMDPAKEVGGDFYDFFLIDHDHLGIVIADVSGKGVPAALFMVIAKTLIKNRALSGERVDEVFTHANNQLCEGNAEDMFVTAWIGIIELSTGHMQWCDAGHEIPYLIHGDGSIEKIMPERKKLPLAAIEDTGYVSNELDLNRGDMIFLYTDGVPEACDMNDELYGIRRLEQALSSEYRADPETLLKAIRSDVDGFVGEAPQFDDLTMLCIQYRGTGRDMSGDPEV